MKKRILVVEDNEGLLVVLLEALHQQGFDAVGTLNAEDTLRGAKNHRPDLLITDVMMPIINGYTLIRQFKKDASLMPVPVVLISAAASLDPIFLAHVEIQGFLAKPFPLEKLVDLVKKLTK